MKVKVFYSKEWQIVSSVYHLFFPPYSPFKNSDIFTSSFLFSRDLSKLCRLYLEIKKLDSEELENFFWEFSPLGNKNHRLKHLVESIEVFNWNFS